MRAIGRLGAYAALLAVVFLGAYAGAAAVVPEDRARTWSEESEHEDGMTRDPADTRGTDGEHEEGADDDR